jgi:hypothetical protein
MLYWNALSEQLRHQLLLNKVIIPEADLLYMLNISNHITLLLFFLASDCQHRDVIYLLHARRVILNLLLNLPQQAG